MRVVAVIVGLAVGVVVAFGAAQANGPAGGPGERTTAEPALIAFIGADGKITGREFDRVTDSEAWLDLWSRHTGQKKDELAWSGAFPKVDFTRCIVVAFFRGKSINTRGEELQAVDEVDGKLRLRFCTSSYQTMSLSGQDHGVEGVSFGIWILPRSTKAIVVEENVQSLMGKPPEWKQQAKFEPIMQ